MIEMHEEQSWQRGRSSVNNRRVNQDFVDRLEHRIQSRLDETGHGWNPSMRFGISDAERVYCTTTQRERIHLVDHRLARVHGCHLCEVP